MVIRKKADPSTDARGSSKSTALKMWALGWDVGLLPIAEFITSVEDGLPVPEGPARLIAAALRAFFCHRDTDASLKEFALKLGLRRKQGKRAPTAAELDYVSVACLEIAMCENEFVVIGEPARRAQSRALREYGDKHGVPLRTVQVWWKSQGDAARKITALAAWAKAARRKRAMKSPG